MIIALLIYQILDKLDAYFRTKLPNPSACTLDLLRNIKFLLLSKILMDLT
jgi:hypothetical protein